MDALATNLLKRARLLGIETCSDFSPELLVPEPRVREYCLENKCGNYNNNYMCPPHVGSLEEITARIKKFQQGILLQYSQSMDVKNDREGLKQTKVAFHNKILQLEESLKNEGVKRVWGMIGGSCGLCEACQARIGEPCSFPDKARPSLESIGVDVIALLERFGLDNKFHPDRIIWTGCLLF